MKLIRRTNKRQLIRYAATSVLLLAIAALAPAQQLSSLEEATMIAEEMLAQQVDPITAALARVDTTRAAVALRSQSGVREETPAEVDAYAESVLSLSRHPKVETLGALTVAIQDPEPTVRLAALTALREGASADQPRSAALMAARSMITYEQDSVMRRQAFEAYCRWGDQDDVLALSIALGREAGPVRDLAVREWLRIERERQ